MPSPLIKNIEDWGIEDPKGKPIEKVRAIRDQIEQKVLELLNRIKQENKK